MKMNDYEKQSGLKNVLSRQSWILILIIWLLFFTSNLIRITIDYKIRIEEEREIYNESIREKLISDVSNGVLLSSAILENHKDESFDLVIGDIISALESIVLSEESYYFGTDYEGNTLIGPGKGQNVYNIQDKNGYKVVQELIKAAKAGGAFVEYTMPPIDNVEQNKKISYVLPLGNYGVYIGAGLEYDYINQVEKHILKEVRLDFLYSFIQLMIMSILIIIILLILGKRLYNKVYKCVKRLIEYIEMASSSDIAIPKDVFLINEFQDIAVKTQELINKRNEQSSLLENQIRSENLRLEKMLEERSIELKKATEELIKSEKMASLSNIVVGVAHEINTPVGVAITTQSYKTRLTNQVNQKLQDNTLTKSELLNYFNSVIESNEILDTSLNRSAELINSFKTILVTHNNDILVDFNVTDHVDSVILMSKLEYKNTSCSIKLRNKKEIMIHSYQSAFSQIITNLIMNSLVYAFDGIETGQIIIELKKIDKDLLLIYEDNGIGIADENIKMVFEPFFTTNRGKGGSGLGLSVVYNFVTERLDGTISLKSAVGEGVRFEILIPNVIV